MSRGFTALQALSSAELHVLRENVWRQVTTQIDGIAIGPAVSALDRIGALRRIAEDPGIRAGQIVANCGCRPGYLHVILKLLAIQGWLTREGPAGANMRLWLVPGAQDLPGYSRVYANSLAALRVMQSLKCGYVSPEADEVWQLSARSWGWPGEDKLLRRIHSHLDGHLVAGLLAALARQGNLPEPAKADGPLAVAELAQECGVSEQWILGLLCRLGWADLGESWDWTAAGMMAALMFPQYWYPLTYAQTFLEMDALLGGASLGAHDETGDERHLDRGLDIRFSGEVFNRNCRDPFLAMLLPVFAKPAANQPRYLVDIGCGNGALLEFAWQAAVGHSGENLLDRPLIAVGMDVNRIARAAASARLCAGRIPNLMLPGDVSDPAAVHRTLLEHGIRCDDALFLAKSVIHNRRYQPPRRRTETDPGDCDGLAFVAENGDLLQTRDVEESLVDLLSAWRPVIQAHGWIVIEAHTAPATVGSANIGRSLLTVLDATHGFSRQYLLTPERFCAAAGRAGLVSTAHCETGRPEVGHTVLTYDHFLPRQSG